MPATTVHLAPRLISRGGWAAWLFRVALGTKPIYAAAALHPVIKIGFALQTLDDANFLTGTVGLNLPIVFGNSLWFEDDADSGGFGHAFNMPRKG
jgi:hypothetical protein